MGETVASLQAAWMAREPTQPLLTWYDDATGERIELSGVSLRNWVSKTANLIIDGCGLEPGDRAEVRLPPHWQTAAVLLGCWAAGLEVVSAAGDIAFVAAGQESAAPDRFVLGFAPMGMPMRGGVPDGWLDYVAEVRGYGDHFAGAAPGEFALDGLRQAEVVARSAARAAELGIPSDGRILIDAATHPAALDWLLAPAAAGASVVLCANLDPTLLPARLEAERASPLA